MTQLTTTSDRSDNVIERCVQLAKPVQNDQQHELRDLETMIWYHEGVVCGCIELSCLPNEKESFLQLSKQEMARLQQERNKLTNEKLKRLSTKHFQELSFEPLKWRDEMGWPRLSLFDTDGRSIMFRATVEKPTSVKIGNVWGILVNYRLAIGTNPLQPFMDLYFDVLLKLQTMVTDRLSTRENLTVVLQSRWDGILPSKARQVLQASQYRFNSEGCCTFLLAEPTSPWVVEESSEPSRTPAQKDPLIVVFCKDKLWLVDSFDPTPLENYVASEFRN